MDKRRQTDADRRGMKQRKRHEQDEEFEPVRQSSKASWRPSDDLYGNDPGDLDLDHGKYEAPIDR